MSRWRIHRMTTRFSLALVGLSLLCLLGCTDRSAIATVRIADPDAGVSIEAPVQPDGTFRGELRNDSVACVASGTVGAAVDGVYTVDVLYDRQLRTGSTTSDSDKLELTLQTQPEVEVPIGQNPSKPADAQTTAENKLVKVTMRLMKRQ